MRIFCISGSRNKRSVGAELAKLLQKKFNDVGDKTDFYIGENLNLSPCNGCSTCFDNGICPLDDVDGFNSVKENILEADLVIIISPVYVNNVSGIIKNFIDRIAYWFHILKLSGKMGIVISIADNSGAEFVVDYLEKVLTFSGCNVIEKYNIIKTQSNLPLERIADNIYKNVELAKKNEKQYHSTFDLEKQFQYLKRSYMLYKNAILEEAYEVKYWYTTGLIECNSFQEWLHKKRHKH